MAIHMYCGEMDEFKLAKPDKMFSDTLAKYNLPYTYSLDPTGDHVYSLIKSFPQGINFLYHVMDTAQIRNITIADKISLAKAWTVYPNPANDRFFVSGASNNLLYIDIYNLSGQKVIQIENPIPDKGIDISMLGKGVYIISLKSEKGNISTKLIKK